MPLIALIAWQGSKAYLRRMRRLLIRVIMLLAVLLMPLGMAAPAVASAAAHHGAASGMPMEHCPEQGSNTDTAGGLDRCTMTCSAALPVLDAPPAHALLISSVPDDLPLGPELASIAQDIATPPPKLP